MRNVPYRGQQCTGQKGRFLQPQILKTCQVCSSRPMTDPSVYNILPSLPAPKFSGLPRIIIEPGLSPLMIYIVFLLSDDFFWHHSTAGWNGETECLRPESLHYGTALPAPVSHRGRGESGRKMGSFIRRHRQQRRRHLKENGENR